MSIKDAPTDPFWHTVAAQLAAVLDHEIKAQKAWQARVRTAYQMGWLRGKKDAIATIGPEAPELARVVDFIPYATDPVREYGELEDLLRVPGRETP